MATGNFGRSVSIDEMQDGRIRILTDACCREEVVGGGEVETAKVQVDVFMDKAEFNALFKPIYDKLRVEVKNLAAAENAVPAQKKFDGLDIS